MIVISQIGRLIRILHRLSDFFVRKSYISQFLDFGEHSYVGHECMFTYPTVSIGHHTYIGSKCVFQSSHGLIKIGNHVMFGPGVHIHGGDHIYNQIGVYMNEVKKESGQDKEVIIKDDVWVGANAIILGGKTGITIGEGCVIGAGSIVTKSTPPYAIVVGNPARVVKMRFTEEELIEHKRILSNRE